MTLTPTKLEHFNLYEEVRIEGNWNMFSAEAMEATGLNQDDYSYVMQNYAALKKAANE